MNACFFTGKGGAGKTTIASAFSWQLSQHNFKTLLISLDPAHNLKDIFDIKGKKTCQNINSYLSIQEPDFERIKLEYFNQRLMMLKGMTQHLSAFNLEKYLNTLKYSPGHEDYAAILFMTRLLKNEKDKYDYIVFDTPPTGMTLRIFSLPVVSVLWIEKLINLREKIIERRNTINSIRAGKKEGIQNKDSILEKLKQLCSDYSDLENFYKYDARVYVVANQDRLALNESARLIKELTNLDIEIAGIIHNKYKERMEPEMDQLLGCPGKPVINVHEQVIKEKGYEISVNLLKALGIHNDEYSPV